MVGELSSSETQGQIVGARESLNGRKNMAWRKVKNFEKSPWGLCLTRPVLNGRRPSAFWLGRKTQKFSGTNQKSEWRRPFETGLVRHCPQGLFLPFFTFLHAIFFRPFRLSLAPTLCSWVSENGELSAIKYIYISLTDLKWKKLHGLKTQLLILFIWLKFVEWHEVFDFPTSISVFNLGCVNILTQDEVIVESYWCKKKLRHL